MLSLGDLPLFKDILSRFSNQRILVIGDVMVDQYIWGKVERISPEAPVPVVRVHNESIRLGGASNVVNNLRTLGARVSLAGVVGDDDMGQRVIGLLNERGVETDGIAINKIARTTLKTRIIAHNQQVVRVDREDTGKINGHSYDTLMSFIKEQIPLVDAVIISDYAKGVISKELAQETINTCKAHNKFCAIDPKVPHMLFYRNASLLTPNHHEAGQATNISIQNLQDIKQAGTLLRKMVEADAILITYGERGMVLFDEDDLMTHIETVARAVYDVTGAGDTVISTLTLAIASGASMINAAILSNFAAGVVVGKVGTSTVDLNEIIDALTWFATHTTEKR